MLFALIGLSGCAQPARTAGADMQQLYTESDEPADVRRARLRMQLALGYYENGKYTVALDEVKQALSLDPRLIDAYNLRGLSYMELGEHRLAEDSFRRALAIKPQDGDTLHNLGWFLCQQQRHAEAAQAFDQAAVAPGYVGRNKSLMVKGLCEMRAGQNAAAERTLQRVLAVEPTNPIAAYNLAQLEHQRGDHAGAQVLMRRLNDTDLANAETLWLGIKIERKLGGSAQMNQWSQRLRSRYANSKEALKLERGEFDE